MKTQFIPDVTPIQQKSRRIAIHLEERVEKELNKLIDQQHFIKLEKHSEKQFRSPIVITVKKDQTVKIALDSKKTNKFIHKNKYHMPNIDLLLDNIAQTIKSDNKNKRCSLPLINGMCIHKSFWIRKQENNVISVSGGNAPGTYQFQTGFCGLTDMPALFQKAIWY